ncbi:ecto-NOX disulfide-thiol exchanger 2-like [Glandiceps talaboti]
MAAPVFPFLQQGGLAPTPNIVGLPGGLPTGNVVDPSRNNAPLDFNSKASGSILGTNPVDAVRGKDLKQDAASVVPSDPGMTGASFGAIESWSNPTGSWGTMSQLGMAAFQGDPNVMNQWQMTGGFGMVPPPPPPDMQQKDVIHSKSCTLFPPVPGMPPRTTRERPPGCRTVFIGGLPQNATEDIVTEIFERCGGITSIRMSKKNFCHIRFENELCVDNAIYLSGYRVRLGATADPPNMGRLHVDFAQARDDLYEYECRQRQLHREARHRAQMEEQMYRPPSPQPIIHYSEHESSLLAEQLKADETFAMSVQTLATWLERGDCTKRNANTFYSMIQSSNSHIKTLLNDKKLFDEQLEKEKELHSQRINGILVQFDQIDRVFTAASKQKAWDHFSKAQRKHIEQWRRQAEEIKKTQQKDLLSDRTEVDMDVSSDTEDTVALETEPAMKKQKIIESAYMISQPGEVDHLKEENDSLRCQLEAYKNEVDILKTEYKQFSDIKETNIKALQHALQGLQQQLMAARAEAKQSEKPEVEKKQEKPGPLMQWLKKAAVVKEIQKDEDVQEKSTENETEEKTDTEAEKDTSPTSSQETTEKVKEKVDKMKVSELEALLVGLLATFLHVHPFGASVEYLWSYISRLDSKVSPADVEDLMIKLPTVFEQELFGVGATLEKRWKFCGFETCLKKKP